MFYAASGLKRLFDPRSNPPASASLKPQQTNDSVIEDSVTRDLLFPVLNGLHEGQVSLSTSRHGDPASTAASAKSTDDNAGPEGLTSRDTRIVVAQRTNDGPRVLLDTMPPTPYVPARTNTSPGEWESRRRGTRNIGDPKNSSRGSITRTAPHSRHVSLSHTSNGHVSPGAAPSNGTTGRGGFFGSSRTKTTAARDFMLDTETPSLRVVKQEREQQEEILKFMFGTPGHMVSSSTKVHVKPQAILSPSPCQPLSPNASAALSPRAAESRRSFLFRSHTAEDLVNMPASPALHCGEFQQLLPGRGSIIVTRIFTVNITENDLNFVPATSMSQQTAPVGEDAEGRRPSLQSFTSTSSKQMKSPSFAVSLVIYFPVRHRRSSTPTSTPRTPTKERAHSPAPFSFGRESSSARTYNSDFEAVMDRLVLIVRALQTLECMAKSSIKKIILSHFDGSPASIRRAFEDDSLAMQSDPTMRQQVDFALKRVAHSLQVRFVVPGQDRWALWKGVARTVGLSSIDSTTYNFLLRLISNLLAIHHEWINRLAAALSQRARSQPQQDHAQEIEPVLTRTVIVCSDKMLSRRIVFLLSMLLPGNQLSSFQSEPTSRQLPPSFPYSSSFNSHHNSSPNSPIKLERQRTPAFTSSEDFAENPADQSSPHKAVHIRRPSDAMSIRSIAMPIRHPGTRSSSMTTTATAATIIPDAYHAIPQFSTFGSTKSSNRSDERPGSGGSLAALSLQRTLSRTDSNEHSYSSIGSRQRDRYSSSARSGGFWGNRRDSSTSISETVSSSTENGSRAPFLSGKEIRRPHPSLQAMVEDATALSLTESSAVANGPTSSPNRKMTKHSPPEPIAAPPVPPDSFPLTLSFDSEDNVLDVQLALSPSPTNTSPLVPRLLPLHASFTTTTTTTSSGGSFDSASSPAQSHVHNQYPHLYLPHPRTNDTCNHIAGYIRAFHPDFGLQAVRPYPELMKDVKSAMYTEATCLSHANAAEGKKELNTLLVDPVAQTLQLLTLKPSETSSSTQHSIQQFKLATQEVDPILAEALSKILGLASPAPPHDSSGQHGLGSSPRPTAATLDRLPRSSNIGEETRRLLWGALERIVRSAMKEEDEQGDVNEGVEGDTAKEGVRGAETGNGILKLAVRKWLTGRHSSTGA